MASRFVPNRNFARDLRRKQAAKVRGALREVAEPAREHADAFARQAQAPWMPKGSSTGQLVVTEVRGTSVAIVLRGYGAHLIEFGSMNNPAWAPLRRGVRAAGLGLRDSSSTPL